MTDNNVAITGLRGELDALNHPVSDARWGFACKQRDRWAGDLLQLPPSPMTGGEFAALSRPYFDAAAAFALPAGFLFEAASAGHIGHQQGGQVMAASDAAWRQWAKQLPASAELPQLLGRFSSFMRTRCEAAAAKKEKQVSASATVALAAVRQQAARQPNPRPPATNQQQFRPPQPLQQQQQEQAYSYGPPQQQYFSAPPPQPQQSAASYPPPPRPATSGWGGPKTRLCRNWDGTNGSCIRQYKGRCSFVHSEECPEVQKRAGRVAAQNQASSMPPR